jgi:hypothetical protein
MEKEFYFISLNKGATSRTHQRIIVTIRLRTLHVTSLIPTAFVSRATASLRGQNIVVAMACRFVRSASDHVSGVRPLRVADEPGWDTTEPCICRTENHMWQMLKPVKPAHERRLRSNPKSSSARG